MLRLCSSSSTRAKILKSFGVDFIQSGVDFDEDAIKYREPRAFVYSATMGKLEVAKSCFGLEYPLLVADTVVVSSSGQILRKAKNINDAREILNLQSGKRISIITASSLLSKKLHFIDISSTEYIFDEFDRDDLENYLQSGLWQDKAGACMVEGFCKKYIREVKGLESNAKGLPIEKILVWIERED